MNSIQYLQSAVDSVLEAGKIVLEIYHSDFKVKDKGKNDPVTEADLKASSHISESLRFLNIPILSEEDSEKKDVSQLQTVWILDPIDGTREFVHKNPEFAISLGLSVLGRAVLGVVFNPVTLELIYGAEDLGVVYQKLEKIPDSFSVELQNFTKILSDFKPIQKVLISRTEEKEGLFSSSMIPLGWEFAAMGSIAYKLGLVAAGKAALSISLKPKNDWDICAGIALINSSGGSDLEIRTGEPYKFQTLSGRGEGLIAGHTLSLTQVWESSKSYFQYSLRDWS